VYLKLDTQIVIDSNHNTIVLLSLQMRLNICLEQSRIAYILWGVECT